MTRKKFVGSDPSSHNSENTWFTPKIFFELLGPFDLDPCTMSFAPFKTATISVCRDLGQCGLEYNWEGRVWLNPPYGKEITPFLDKFKAHKKGICLIFARMGSEQIQNLLNHGAYLYCLRNRIAFINKEGISSTNAGCDSCFIFYDADEIINVTKFKGVLLRKCIIELDL